MFLTQGNKSFDFVVILLLLTVVNVFSEFVSSPLLSNDMYHVEGNGDTLFINTSHGVNYTEVLTSDSITWYGAKKIDAQRIYYVNGCAVLTLGGGSQYLNSFKIYDVKTKIETAGALPFKLDNFNNSGESFDLDYYFTIEDVLWKDSSYWMACFDGGLVKYNSDVDIEVYIPTDSNTYFPTAIDTNILSNESKGLNRVVSVTPAGNKKLWVGSVNNLWLFDYSVDSNIVWDSLGFLTDTTKIKSLDPELESIVEVLADPLDTNKVIVFIDYKLKQEQDYPASAAYLFNKEDNSWRRIGSDNYRSISIGKGSDIFLVSYSEKDKIYRFSSDGTKYVEVSGLDFKSRFNNSIDAPLNFEIRDITFSSADSNDVFVVSTSEGLFYSIDEYSDEKSNKPFIFTKRNVQLKSGLEQTYSYPSIINSADIKAFFAYNLSKDSRVTIDIFDYNMDHVVRILDDAPRNAGKNNPSGRSTIESEDYWDGSPQNNGGAAVPPGVYYYKIKTDEGERAFGKVIVAKN